MKFSALKDRRWGILFPSKNNFKKYTVKSKNGRILPTPLLIISLFFCCLTAFSHAQEKKVPSYGKVTLEELTETKCPIDTGAQAYYIFDKGETEFVYLQTTIRSNDAGSSKGFQMKFERHARIKIIDKAASDIGNFEIRLLNRGSDKEQLSGLKGVTYNMVDGKIVKAKLSSKQVNYDKKDNHWTVVKFAMPEVRAGSVIDISYQVLSDFYYNLQEWQFQRMVPVLYSEYTVAIPQYFIYNPEMLGYINIENSKTSTPRSVTITYIQSDEGASVRGYTYTNKENYTDNITKYYSNDIPAFKAEKYLRTSDNYLSKISFEIAGTQFPRSRYNSYSTTWDAVDKKLLEHDDFGLQLDRAGFLKEEVETIMSKNLSGNELVAAAFDRVKKKMTWDRRNRLYSTENLKQSWEKGEGSSADINLTLVSLLKALGVEAYPVAISTRANGIIPITHPSISGFNYVVAMAVVDGNSILLDATETFAGLNQLPERCLNDNGRIIDNTKSGWVNLCENASSDQMIYGKLSLDKEGQFTGSIEIQENGYAAWDRRDSYKLHNDEEAFKEAVEREFKGIEISEFEISGIDSINSIAKGVYQVSLDDRTDQMGDMVVFNPLLAFSLYNNPFKLEKREYPVEFPYSSRQRIIMLYSIPAEFNVESLPATQRMVAEDKSFVFSFSANQVGNEIQIVYDFSLNRSMFLPAEYEVVKNLFASIVNKHNEKIVLKRSEI